MVRSPWHVRLKAKGRVLRNSDLRPTLWTSGTLIGWACVGPRLNNLGLHLDILFRGGSSPAMMSLKPGNICPNAALRAPDVRNTNGTRFGTKFKSRTHSREAVNTQQIMLDWTDYSSDFVSNQLRLLTVIVFDERWKENLEHTLTTEGDLFP